MEKNEDDLKKMKKNEDDLKKNNKKKWLWHNSKLTLYIHSLGELYSPPRILNIVMDFYPKRLGLVMVLINIKIVPILCPSYKAMMIN